MGVYIRVRMDNGDTWCVREMPENDALALVEDFQTDQPIITLSLEESPGRSYVVHLARDKISSIEVGEGPP